MVALLSCSAPEGGATSGTATGAEARSEPPEPEPGGSTEPPSADETLTYRLAPRPEAFFFPDPCLDARAATAEKSLAACRRITRTGTNWERWFCDCTRERLVEVRPDDPIAFYMGCCLATGATPAGARAECERYRQAGCEAEDPELVHVATGPYERRSPRMRDFESAGHRFLIPSYTALADWFGADGDPPCFPTVTPVELAEVSPEGTAPSTGGGAKAPAGGDRRVSARGADDTPEAISLKARAFSVGGPSFSILG